MVASLLAIDMLAGIGTRVAFVSEGILINGITGSVVDTTEPDIVLDIVPRGAAESTRLPFIGYVSSICQGTE